MTNPLVGLGDFSASTYFYIANRPPLGHYQQLDDMYALPEGEIYAIASATGNHWRKIFNVMAKLVYQQSANGFASWQNLRDEKLLRQGSGQCLLFSPLDADAVNISSKLHIIIGKTYAEQMGWAERCHWLNSDFAINEKHKVIICPYFDYRQLSNIKITRLIRLIEQIS